MTLESRIEAGGRRLLTSPLWLGLSITAVLVAPIFLVPGIPVWVGAFWLVTVTPTVLLGTYATFALYRWLRGAVGRDAPTATAAEEPRTRERPIDRLRERYATGEIDEETFERTVERLLETDPNEGGRERDLLRE
ncbi:MULTISPECIES: SHOCT domain-containing protein [Saliphagus]|uniref:SHOCT domain-containing protein n=1 Tax=Saliphagus infecundisoli TaxID=1849069 RepID=A0ABD5QGV1_9EURY|nr:MULTISPECIES: SHOCT domain-containing protein [Saliphagus]